jgi:hypothetical protein
MTAEIKDTLKLETGQIRTLNHPKYGEKLPFLVQARDIVDRGRIPCAEVFSAIWLGGWNWKFQLPDVFIIVQQNAKKFIAINEEIVIN